MQGRALQYFSELHGLVDNAIRDRVFGGVVFFVKREGDWILHHARGSLGAGSEKAPLDEDAIFDVASLTKVLVTAPSVMLLQEVGELKIDDPVVGYIPGFCEGQRRLVTIRDLLTHSSGLPAWAPLYLFADDKDEAIEFLCHIPLEYEPTQRIVYSCLGFILLGRMVERVSGLNLAEFATEHILEPLDLRHTFFNPPRELLERIVPTENGNLHEQGMAARYLDEFSELTRQDASLERYYRRAKKRFNSMRREGLIRGEVHDSNAYFLGGVCGNAGLFSCASDVVQMAEEFLTGATGRGGTAILSAESIQLMIRSHREAEGQRRGLGWQLIEGMETSGGRVISRSAFGHTAFTGCSLWVDPLRELTIVLLSNAVHPTCRKDAIGDFRPAFHDLVVRFSDCIFKPAHA